MAKAPGVRIIDGKRIDLVELRKRRKLARELAKPVEDTRVSDMWARDEARIASSRLDRKERAAIKRLPPKVVPYTDKVDNPEFSRDHREEYAANFKKVKVSINAKESAIGLLASRGALDKAQIKAADRFRSLWERLGGAGAGAMDYTKEAVDGGGATDPISLRQLAAGMELKQCRELLGARNYGLVCRVAGEGHALTELYEEKRDRLTAADNLRAALDDLAIMWKLAGDKSLRYRNDRCTA